MNNLLVILIILITNSDLFLKLVITMRIRNNYLSSPCPNTFIYQMDENNGEIYGRIGVFSLDPNKIKLNVQLSVGNSVDNYNGEIQLLQSKQKVAENIKEGRPVQYKLLFPKWMGSPPKITKILVNDGLVCSGPPLSTSLGFRIITTINLQHTLTVNSIGQLQSNPFLINNNNNNNKNSNNNNNNNRPDVGKFEEDSVEVISIPNDSGSGTNFPTDGNIIVRNPFVTTTTERIPNVNSIPTTRIYSKNPFLSGDIDTYQQPLKPQPPQTPTRGSIPYSDICGISQLANQLVVKGNSVQEQAFPWLVALYHVVSTGLDYQCSGSLITTKHVVTAAHCVKTRTHILDNSKIILVLGKLNLENWIPTANEKMTTASSIHIHPNYTLSDSDIAVVVMTDKIDKFTDYIRPICLWLESSDLKLVVGNKGVVVGWGQDESGNVHTRSPNQISLPIVNQEVCLRSAVQFQYVTSDRTFCAGEQNGRGPCNGDSGSGFIMKRGGKWTLRGIVSTSLKVEENGKATCDLHHYVVFTDAAKFIDWLLPFLYQG